MEKALYKCTTLPLPLPLSKKLLPNVYKNQVCVTKKKHIKQSKTINGGEGGGAHIALINFLYST